jgi:hypothetical protein
MGEYWEASGRKTLHAHTEFAKTDCCQPDAAFQQYYS